MSNRFTRWTNNRAVAAIVGAIVGPLVLWFLNNVTVDFTSEVPEWQSDILWFLVALGWFAFSVTLAMISKYLWDAIQAELERYLRMKRRIRERREEERKAQEQKHQLAFRIWQECDDYVAALGMARNVDDWSMINRLTDRLARNLRGLDPYLDDHSSPTEIDESNWVIAVGEVIEREDPSAKALDRIRTKARVHLQRHDVREKRDPF